MAVLEVKNVSIRYMTGDFKDIGLKEYVMRKLKGDYHVREFWADRDITFSLERGEMLGIIGTNGAGKSTLLKAVAGIMEPTKGKVKRQGSIAALLELASGFDGDLTVRENSYLRGAMLGYTRRFMDETYREIIDFAELGEFIDYPIKAYSSGMLVRLAFAISTSVRGEIMLVDEVLSAGDANFQKKARERMLNIMEQAKILVLVLHDMNTIQAVCNRVVLLQKGEIVADGAPDEIVDQYLGKNG